MEDTQFYSVVEEHGKEEQAAGQELPNKRNIDTVLAQYLGGALPSPIKSKADLDEIECQESIDLKLEVTLSQINSVQPDLSTMTSMDERGIMEISDTNENIEEKIMDPSSEKELMSRKRHQNEMEPAVFELPRASKLPHKEYPPIPEFQSRLEPLIHFGERNTEVFRPKILLNGLCIQEASVTNGQVDLNATYDKECSDIVRPMASDEQHSTSERIGDQGEGQNKVERDDTEKPFDANKTMDFHNATVDMTLRTSGGLSFASAVLSAVDEALDPVFGFVVPRGLQRRGANVAIFAISLLVAIGIWFFY